MGDINSMRGAPGISQSIFKKVKQISESKGEESNQYKPSRPIIDNGGGAYSSLMKRKNEMYEASKPVEKPKEMKKIIESRQSFNTDIYLENLYEGISLLNDTKEYSGVVRSLLTCYLAGKLDSKIIEGVRREDKKEILGIIKEFESTIENILK